MMRQAQQLPQPDASLDLDSPVLRLLGRDSGARHSLMQMLPLKDLASLLCSGRQCRSWIEGVASVGSQSAKVRGGPSEDSQTIRSFASCGWIQRAVQSVQFISDQEERIFNTDDPDELNYTAQFLGLVPLLPRLRSLELTFSDVSERPYDVSLLRDTLSAVAATLTDFCFNICVEKTSWDTSDEWAALAVLTNLISLEVDLSGMDAPQLDLSFLSSMQRLEGISLCLPGRFVPCPPEYAETLAQCRALKHLRCGNFLVPYPSAPHRDMRSLSTLVERRAENGAAPLRYLWLGDDPLMDPQAWRWVSQLTSLESLDNLWSSLLTAEDWLLFKDFSQLRRLTLRSPTGGSVTDFEKLAASAALRNEGRGPLDLDLVLPGLTGCHALRHLLLVGPFELRATHVALLARLPLDRLGCNNLRIESLDPLAAAPALTDLDVTWCMGLRGELINIRTMVPPMPLLSKLTINDYYFSRMTAAEAEPFTASLLQRLPKLNRAQFTQTFKTD